VIGGGHAGTEASLAAARAGARTLLVTHKIATLGQMSCNPAIGGIGKGHLTKEIDALGGAMARAIDRSGIQFRTLNASKGPAVRATRAQADRELYRAAIQAMILGQPNLEVVEAAVDDLLVENGRVAGVVTEFGVSYRSRAVVLTTGTFLGGRILVGKTEKAGGRVGDAPSIRLAERLREMPFNVARLKTGTPPRLDGRSLDLGRMLEQPGDDPRPVFSFLGRRSEHPDQVSCFVTKTTEETHDIIRASLDESPMFSGLIEGVGPRYCPSIEDKIVRFADKNSHQIFVEPEGLNTDIVYPNGISTSMPADVQERFVRSIVGFENAVITQPGYAIEYDYFDPRDLKPTLETKHVSHIGNEACLGALLRGPDQWHDRVRGGGRAGPFGGHQCRASFARARRVVPGASRGLPRRAGRRPDHAWRVRALAEYRLMLREDNADLRLTPKGRELGLVDDERWAAFETKGDAVAAEQARFAATTADGARAAALLKRPELGYAAVVEKIGRSEALDVLDEEQREQVEQQVEVQAKYAGYIDRQEREIAKHAKQESLRLPEDIDYATVDGLSNEARQKLITARPTTLGQASRLEGMTPSAVSLILVHLKKRQLQKSA
jgi:tRNA uridine 5-carboxymethylaminomethyl modification enzyme